MNKDISYQFNENTDDHIVILIKEEYRGTLDLKKYIESIRFNGESVYEARSFDNGIK